MADAPDAPDDCGCCTGAARATPRGKANPPGLPAIAYRVGTHASFKASLLARLSSADFPALAGLSTRADEDWTIAFLDAAATLGDVITFYQERIANEAFLGTAVERRSLLELARLVGYRPSPGVAASTMLAFELDRPLVQPAPPPPPVRVPVGTRLQSVPGEGELPQTFETTAEIEARVEWNALQAQASQPDAPALGQTSLWVQGIANALAPGDLLLLVGAARATNAASTLWQLRTIEAVRTDTRRGATELRWSAGLQQFAAPGGASQGVRAYVLRQRAALFGHNAPDPNIVVPTTTPRASQHLALVTETGGVLAWKNFALTDALPFDLDASYPKIVPGSWAVLVAGTALKLVRVTQAETVSRTAFALAAKVTRLTVDHAAGLAAYGLRATAVFAQSEELALAERPLVQPVFGSIVELADLQPALAAGRNLALRGPRQRVRIGADPAGLAFPDDPSRRPLPGESFVVAAPPQQRSGTTLLAVTPAQLATGAPVLPLRWTLLDHDGVSTVLLDSDGSALEPEPPHDDDLVVDELATVSTIPGAVTHDSLRTTLQLARPLRQVFDRQALRINANVAPATHGETVSETGGSGDAAQTSQRFRLRQAPLTYVSSADAQGRVSTLVARVDGVAWTEVPSLFDQPPDARVYALRQDDAGNTTVQFGDGTEGARLPGGTDNLRFAYRRGLGAAGNVGAGSISTLISRPLGVKAARNPAPAGGGEDAESVDDARRNLPLTVLTMGRAVSLQDHADLARAFAGIAKADAAWFDGRGEHGVLITAAGVGGDAVAPGGPLHANLLAALRASGDALLPLALVPHVDARFELQARLTVDAARRVDDVLAEADAVLRSAFGFDARAFAEPVTVDGVIAVLHGVAGVLAVDVERLRRFDAAAGDPVVEPRLFPQPGRWNGGAPVGAELLTLAPAGPQLSGTVA